MKRSQSRDGSPLSKRSRSGYPPLEHDLRRDRLSPEMDRRGSSRMKPYREYEDEMERPRSKYRDDRYEPDYPPPPPVPRTETRPPEYRSLCVSGVSSKVPDRILKDQMYREFERYGEMNVNITYNGDQRVAYINFKYPEDARAAKHDKYGKLVMFDRPVRIESVYNKIRSSSPPPPGYHERNHFHGGGRGGGYHPEPPMGRGYPPGPPGPPPHGPRDFHGPPPPFRDFHGPPPDRPFHGPPREGGFIPKRAPGSEKFPYHLDHIPPEDDPNATRTLFIGNLDYNISESEIRSIFDAFGHIDEIDIKRPQRGQGNAYAFLKYYNLDMAHRAKVEMSGKYIGRFQCKIGYGKINPSNCLWVGGLGPWVNSQTLESEFDRFGVINRIEWPHGKNYSYVVYENADAAQAALNEMRGFPLGGKDKRIRVDFADPSHVGQNIADVPPPRKDYPSSYDRPRYDGPPPREGWVGPPRDTFDGDRRREDYERHEPGNGYRHPEGPRGDFDDYRRSPGDRRVSRSPGRSYDRDYDRERRRDDYTPPRDGYRRRSRSPDDMAPLTGVASLSDLAKQLPVAWNGALILKSSAFPARMHVLSGNVTIVDTLMRDPTSTETPTLTIKQRLRLDPSKTDDVAKRVVQAGPRNHCVLIAFPSALEHFDDAGRNIQQRPLKNLVSYLKQKEAAGVISLPPYPTKDKDNVGLLHAFPPCQFGYEYLLQRAPKMPADCMLDDFIVVVVVRGAA